MKANGIIFETLDKPVVGGCSKYRPDIVINLTVLVCVVEVDEYQHRRSTYSPECEKIRMMQIHQDFGGIPVVFIRYNPDSYKQFDDDGNFIGTSIKSNTNRLETLLNLINGLRNRQEWTIPLSVYYLFYDGYDNNPTLEQIEY